MRRLALAALACALAALASAACATTPAQPTLQATLKSPNGATVGTAAFRQGPLGFVIRVEGKGLTPGWHGAHLHAVGKCDDPKFQSAGGHLNHPETKRPHGLLNKDGGPDYGDLTNVFVHADGSFAAELYWAGGGLPRAGDFYDADGFSILIHANPDDHVSQPIGGAGDRVACGVVSRVN